MRAGTRALALCTLLLLGSCGRPPGPTPGPAIPVGLAEIPEARVLLAKTDQAAKFLLSPSSPCFFSAYPDDGKPLGEIPAGSPTELRASAEGILVGSRSTGRQDLLIHGPREGFVTLGEDRYRGNFRILQVSASALRVVNLVRLEDYLSGVVGSEMTSSWPEAALEAQAIAARTYALYEIEKSAGRIPPLPGIREKQRDPTYDLADDVRSQAYHGMRAESEKTRRAVRDSFGVVLQYVGQPLPAMYHSTCGGHTERAHLFFPVPDIPPLAGRPCGFCEDSPHSRWKVRIPKAEIQQKLRALRSFSQGESGAASGLEAAVGGPFEVHSLGVLERAPGGRALRLELRDRSDRQRRKISGVEFRLSLGPQRLRSLAFEPKDLGAEIEFEGSGWGHGVGLCQYGARGMAAKGHNARDILRHYYPAAEIVRLY